MNDNGNRLIEEHYLSKSHVITFDCDFDVDDLGFFDAFVLYLC